MERMSRWGVGPSILMTALCYIVVASTVTHHWPDVCLIRAVPHRVFQVVGVLLLAIGVPLVVVALIALNRNYDRDQLATGGIYGIVRNPIYSAWVVFLIPGLVLLSPSWPLLLTPLVTYIAFKATIAREEACLEERFGDTYRIYRSEVRELLPFPRHRRRPGP
jgi:protein-S-isoprenylcysteine O-methyltransferase Ste14